MYRYIDVLPKFVKAYDPVHSATCMAQSKVSDSDMLAIWNKMFGRQCSKACGIQLSGGTTLASAKKSSCLRRATSKTTPPRYSTYLSRAQDSATGVRIGKYARSAYRRVILRGGNDSRAHHETHYVQEI